MELKISWLTVTISQPHGEVSNRNLPTVYLLSNVAYNFSNWPKNTVCKLWYLYIRVYTEVHIAWCGSCQMLLKYKNAHNSPAQIGQTLKGIPHTFCWKVSLAPIVLSFKALFLIGLLMPKLSVHKKGHSQEVSDPKCFRF